MGIKSKNSREIGTVYENKAVLFLQKKGYQIVETNFYAKQGEIDIVAKEGEYLVFVEVKYRKSYKGAALEAVTPAKRKRLIQTARYYLHKKHYGEIEVPCRFDVIAFDGEEIVHIIDAFSC